MTVQNSVACRNARLDSFETTVGTDAVLKLRTGAQPANCAAADTGTVVATMTLPSDWLAPASGGQKSKSGTWQDLSADNAGIIGHYRIYASDGVTCHEQGSVTEAGGGGDMICDNTDVNAGQQITITSYTKTAGNA